MRHPPRGRESRDERMITRLGAPKDTRNLFAESCPLDTVQVQHRGVCRETGPDSWRRRLVRPVHQARERWPVNLFGKRLGARLSAGHDESVELAGPELLDWLVVLCDVCSSDLSANQLGEREKANADVVIGAGCGEQPGELLLCHL